MKTKYTFTHPDIVLQSLVLFPMLFCYCLMILEVFFVVWALLVQLGVGIIQLSSGLFYTLIKQSNWHKRYFIAAGTYVLFLLFLLAWTSQNSSDTIFFTCFGIFSAFIPVCIAIWYYYKSLAYHQSSTVLPKQGADDVLDDLFN